MSIGSYSYNQKSLQGSNDLQQISQQLKIYQQQNIILKDSLQTMIKVNTQLIDSIQQYAKLYGQGYGTINQQQLQEINMKVEILQRKINQEKQKNIMTRSKQLSHNRNSMSHNKFERQSYQIKQSKYHPKSNNDINGHQILNNINGHHNHNDIQQILVVIEELAHNFQTMQGQFYRQIEKLQQELKMQKQNSDNVFKQMQNKLKSFNQLFKQLVSQINSKNQVINNLNRQISIGRNKKSQIHKQMKISLTIQDLKNTLQKKIQEKEQIIKVYQQMIYELKIKFQQKI